MSEIKKDAEFLKTICIKQLTEHKILVKNLLNKIILLLQERAETHDNSKFEDPEFELFSSNTVLLNKIIYGTDEYKKILEYLKPALTHHYAVSRHHVEHHENGIQGMNLIDIIEMFVDWFCASKRASQHNMGSIQRSIDINQKRFNFSDDLRKIFENTIEILEEKEQNKKEAQEQVELARLKQKYEKGEK